jgi:hypothetical protein
MSGPRSLQELITRLSVPDQHSALVRLIQELMPGQTGPADTVVALVWATPNVSRTLEEVAAPFVDGERDRILEGRVRSTRLGAIALLVEQPEMEARLAAFVSRHGQGLAAVYLDRPRFVPQPDPAGRPARPARTPLGRRGWLLPHEWPWGPFVIALEERC